MAVENIFNGLTWALNFFVNTISFLLANLIMVMLIVWLAGVVWFVVRKKRSVPLSLIWFVPEQRILEVRERIKQRREEIQEQIQRKKEVKSKEEEKKK